MKITLNRFTQSLRPRRNAPASASGSTAPMAPDSLDRPLGAAPAVPLSAAYALATPGSHSSQAGATRTSLNEAPVQLQDLSPPPLTRASLKAWEKAPGLSRVEAQARRDAAECIRKASNFTARSNTKLVIRDLNLESVTHLRSLPEGLQVGGDLRVNGLKNLTALPRGLTVKGDLHARSSGLLTLPGDLDVGRDVDLRNSDITRLPSDLSIPGNLLLMGCQHLEDLPTGLKVERQLDISQCDGITTLPADLQVGLHLKMNECAQLETLPGALQLPPSVDASGCAKLRQTPDHFDGRYFVAKNCPNLEVLFPVSMRVENKCDISDCVNIREFPADAHVHELIAVRCESLTRLPQTLRGEANISDCVSVTALPPDFQPFRLTMERCHGIETLPLSATQRLLKLNMAYCSNFKAYPDNFVCEGDVDARFCGALETLSSGFRVKGDCDLSGTGLRSIDADVKIGELNYRRQTQHTFTLRDCPNLETLPDNWQLDAQLVLSGSHNLREIPINLKADALDASNCLGLVRVRAGFKLSKAIFSDCTNLVVIEAGRVSGGLLARRCSSLDTVQATFGSGHFNHCTALKVLSADLDFYDLDVSDCVALERLPSNLHARSSVIAAGCTALYYIPDETVISGRLDVRDCPRIVGITDAFAAANDRGESETYWFDDAGYNDHWATRDPRMTVDAAGSGIAEVEVTAALRRIMHFDFTPRPVDTEGPVNGANAPGSAAQRAMECKYYNYATLRPEKLTEEICTRLTCPFTLDGYDDIAKPLVVYVLGVPRVFNGEPGSDFFRWWIEKGTDPVSKQNLHMRDFRRGEKVAAQDETLAE